MEDCEATRTSRTEAESAGEGSVEAENNSAQAGRRFHSSAQEGLKFLPFDCDFDDPLHQTESFRGARLGKPVPTDCRRPMES